MISDGESVVSKDERESIRKRYQQERDKRVRAEGTGQYINLDPIS